jgi:hypothetical protein
MEDLQYDRPYAFVQWGLCLETSQEKKSNKTHHGIEIHSSQEVTWPGRDRAMVSAVRGESGNQVQRDLISPGMLISSCPLGDLEMSTR